MAADLPDEIQQRLAELYELREARRAGRERLTELRERATAAIGAGESQTDDLAALVMVMQEGIDALGNQVDNLEEQFIILATSVRHRFDELEDSD